MEEDELSYSNFNFLRRLYWRFGRALGGRTAAAVWDDQYSRGVWQEFDNGRSSEVLDVVNSFGVDLDLVEFGCGEGSLVFALKPEVIRSYRGFDISSTAVARAKHNFAQEGMDICSASCTDLATLSNLDACDLILAEECLYYLSRRELKQLLAVAWRAIRSGGGLIAVVHDGEKHAWVLDLVRSFSDQCEVRDFMIESRSAVLLVKS